jgi:hypothetical protein
MAGGILFIRKCEKSLEIIRKWIKVFYDDFALVDDSPSKYPNFPEFIENRHDQSVWSLLVKLNGVRRLSHSEQCEVDDKYPIWALRDKQRMGTATFFAARTTIQLKKTLKKLLPGIYGKLKSLRTTLIKK